ncbi:MAG: hypothetical protein MK538_07155 [Planctomycetes bacterium]|nr:hypothetical protein [Planctomycetota bacterium]
MFATDFVEEASVPLKERPQAFEVGAARAGRNEGALLTVDQTKAQLLLQVCNELARR